jgi:hypothetical protein
MNNPIGRMPNPMAVPQIPPMGANPTAQNPSAMPLPVVNQPKVDMQTMGTTASQRKRFNDLMESLSAPRQKSEDLPNVQGLHYGGMAGGFGMPMMPMMNPYMGMGMGMGMGGMGMNPYSMAYPSYSPGFGTTPTAPTTPTTPTDTNQNPFGSTLTPRQEPVPTYGNMDSGTFPDASGNALINNPSMGESPAMDAPVDPSDMPMFQPIDFNKQPTTPPSKYGVYGPDQLGAFVEDMIKKGNFNNTSVGQPITDMQDRIDLMDRFQIPGVGMREDQQYRPAVIDPNSPEEIEKRNKLMDYLGSLGTVPMNNFQGYERGGDVQYLKGGGPTMPSGKYSYSKDLDEKIAKLIGGAITTPEEERFKSPPKMGMLKPPMYEGDVGRQRLPEMGSRYNNPLEGQYHGREVLSPVFPTTRYAASELGHTMEKDHYFDALKDQLYTGVNVRKDRMYFDPDTYQEFYGDPTQVAEKSRRSNFPQQQKLDAMRPLNIGGLQNFQSDMMPPVLGKPESGSIGPMYGFDNYAPIDELGVQNIPAETTFEDDFSLLERLGYNVKDLLSGIGFANGGSVQYLRGGGPTKLDTSTNEDTTIPKFFSNISNMIKNLISPVNKAKSVDTGYGDLSDPKSAFPGSDLNYHDHLSNLAKEQSNLEIPTLEKIEKETKFPEQNVRLNMPRQNLISPAVKIPDISTASGINDVTPPEYEKAKLMKPFDTYNPYLSTNYMPNQEKYPNLPKGMGPSDFEFDDFDISIGTPPSKDFVANLAPASQYLQSQKPFMPITSAQMPQANPLDPMTPVGVQDPSEIQKDFVANLVPAPQYLPKDKSLTLPTPPDRPKNISQIAENIAAQSGQQGQQGFGIGQFLPLILGMFNPKLGMALGIMQAMGGKGEGEGLLGGILPNLAKTLGIGDTERTFGDYTFRSLEDPKSGESAGMTPEERRELFLKNQASNERNRAGREMQENIDAITKPTVPDPILGEDGSYSCPLPYVYDPNTKMCVMMEAGLGGQGAAANETEAPAGMQMGGQVSPSLNNAVDNFLQALA